jgi:WD40 repeat protein
MDWLAQIHDAKTGEQVRTEINDHGVPTTAMFSPDSQFLLLASSGKRARAWPVRDSHQVELNDAIASLEHSDGVMVATMTRDSRRIATGSADKTLRVWHATPGLGRALPEKLPTAQPVSFMELSSRGARLATVSEDPSGAQIWDMATRQPVTSFLPHPQTIHCARFSGDERRLITGGENGRAFVWDASNGKLITQLKHPSGAQMNAITLNVDGSRAASATSSEVLLWDIAIGRAIPLLVKTAEHAVPEFEFTPDGTHLLTISAGQLDAWEGVTGKRKWGPVPVAKDSTLRVSPDGRRICVVAADGGVAHFETITGKPGSSGPNRTFADGVFSADGRLVAKKGGRPRQPGFARVWDAETGAAITQPLPCEDEVQTVGLSPDGTLVWAAERGGLVRVWSVATGRECIDPLPHNPSIYPVLFSPDRRWLLTVTDGVMQFHELWDLGGPAPLWLPDLAEAIGGLALNDYGVAAPLDRPLQKLEQVRSAIGAAAGDDPHLIWARWFFADRRTRHVSPLSQRTMREELTHKP